MTVKGFSNVECACGCHNLLTLATYNNGRIFIYGHKGNKGYETVKDKALRLQAASTPNGKVIHTSYTRTLEMACEDLVALRKRESELLDEARIHTAKCEEITKQLDNINTKIKQLEMLGVALEPFVDNKLLGLTKVSIDEIKTKDDTSILVSTEVNQGEDNEVVSSIQ